MSLTTFIKKAINQDNRNQFEPYSGNLDIVPDGLKKFYREYNPIDVEVISDYNPIHFYSVQELSSLQQEYSFIKDGFVFATCNGDPIFVNDSGVYTCAHGIRVPTKEKLANNVDDYLDSLI